jgi:type II secretory pathway component PulF
MIDIAFIAAFPLLLLLGGFLLLWYVARRRKRQRIDTPTLNGLLVITGWIVLLTGVLLYVLMTTWSAATAMLPAVIVILIAGVRWYRRAEGRTLLWALTDAADRGIPLAAIARAYGDETRGLLGSRAVKLAEYLEAAVPLSLALKLANISVPLDVQLAADVGERNGTLGVSLRKVSQQIDENDLIMRAVMEKAFYLIFLCCWVPLALVVLLTYLLIRVLPIYQELTEQFQSQLPTVTVRLIDFAGLFATYWYLALPICMVFGLIFVGGVLAYVGIPLRRFPILRRFLWRADAATILHLLGIAVREGRPIAESSRLLASYFVQPGPRRSLERAAAKMNKGGAWWEALRQVGIVSTSQSRLLAAAERAGNLPWAMDEMAASMTRRVAYRTRAWVTAIIPVLILIFGFGVLLVAVAIYAPLVKLIQWLC